MEGIEDFTVGEGQLGYNGLVRNLPGRGADPTVVICVIGM